MTSASGTPSGCIVSVGSLAGGVAGAPPPANSLQASGLLIGGDALGSSVPESSAVFCKTKSKNGGKNYQQTMDRGFKLQRPRTA